MMKVKELSTFKGATVVTPAEGPVPGTAADVGPAGPVRVADPVNVLGVREIEAKERFFLRQPMGSVFSAIKSHLSEASSLVLHLAASMPREGTSTVARELAHVAASAPWCRVLLLDGNPGRNDQSAYFGASSLPEVGVHPIDGSSIDTVRIGFRHVHFDLATIPISGGQSEPAAVRATYAALRRAFTLVIVDCPPILTTPDTAVLSEYADGVLLVVEAERTRSPVIVRAKEEIQAAGGSVKGVIMNKRRYYIPRFIYNRL